MVIKQKNRNSTPTQSSHRQDTHGDWRIKRTPTQNKTRTHTYRLHALLSSSGLAVACEEGPGRQPIVVQQTDDHNYHYSHHHNYDYYLNKLQFSCKTRKQRENQLHISHNCRSYKIFTFSIENEWFPCANSLLGCRGWLPGQCYAVAKVVIVHRKSQVFLKKKIRNAKQKNAHNFSRCYSNSARLIGH